MLRSPQPCQEIRNAKCEMRKAVRNFEFRMISHFEFRISFPSDRVYQHGARCRQTMLSGYASLPASPLRKGRLYYNWLSAEFRALEAMRTQEDWRHRDDDEYTTGD